MNGFTVDLNSGYSQIPLCEDLGTLLGVGGGYSVMSLVFYF